MLFIKESTIMGVVAVRLFGSTTTRFLNFSPMIRLAAAFPTGDDGARGYFLDTDCIPVLTVLNRLNTAGESLSYLSTLRGPKPSYLSIHNGIWGMRSF